MAQHINTTRQERRERIGFIICAAILLPLFVIQLFLYIISL